MFQPRDVWLVDCGPADVNGSDVICGSSEAAFKTAEVLSALASVKYFRG